jgi:hypothetical protein
MRRTYAILRSTVGAGLCITADIIAQCSCGPCWLRQTSTSRAEYERGEQPEHRRSRIHLRSPAIKLLHAHAFICAAWSSATYPVSDVAPSVQPQLTGTLADERRRQPSAASLRSHGLHI